MEISILISIGVAEHMEDFSSTMNDGYVCGNFAA